MKDAAANFRKPLILDFEQRPPLSPTDQPNSLGIRCDQFFFGRIGWLVRAWVETKPMPLQLRTRILNVHARPDPSCKGSLERLLVARQSRGAAPQHHSDKQRSGCGSTWKGSHGHLAGAIRSGALFFGVFTRVLTG